MLNALISSRRSGIILCLILIATFILFIFNLTNVPYGFHEDEAHIGYNAYSLLKTARDKNNVFLPLAIDQFGDFRPSGLHFLTVPSVAVFGLTVFATRFPVALAGTVSVAIFYFLGVELFASETIALIGAALFAITPWLIIASRSTSESIVAELFVMMGVYFLFRFLKTEKRRTTMIICSSGACILSFFFYHAARFFVPVFLVYFFFSIRFIYWKQKRMLITFSIALLCIFAALTLIIKLSNGGNRPIDISIFNSPATKLLIDQQVRYAGRHNRFFARFLHNKYIDYPEAVLDNYFQHFDSGFLYFKGGLPPRYQVSGSGNFYLIEGLFFMIGLGLLISEIIKNWKNVFSPMGSILVWLLIGPIPAALTFEDIPHFQRSIMMLPAFVLIATYGIYKTFAAIKSDTLRFLTGVVIGGIFLFSFTYFLHSYFIDSFDFQTIYRNEGEKELTQAIASYTKQGYTSILTMELGNRLIFYLFYYKIDPNYYQHLMSPRDSDGLHFENLFFSQAQCPTNDPKALSYSTNVKTIYVNRFDCKPPKQFKTIQNIYYPDGDVAFQIDTLVNPAQQ